MTRAEALALLGDPSDVWPACGCSEDEHETEGTGHADRCLGPTNPKLGMLGPDPQSDEPCRCLCH